MPVYMLDTDISSYVMKRSHDAVLRRLEKVPVGDVCISVITKSELLYGVDGSFTLGNVIPGRYRLLAVERGWELEWANRDVLSAFLKKSLPIEVHADDKLTRMVEVQSR